MLWFSFSYCMGLSANTEVIGHGSDVESSSCGTREVHAITHLYVSSRISKVTACLGVCKLLQPIVCLCKLLRCHMLYWPIYWPIYWQCHMPYIGSAIIYYVVVTAVL